LNAERVDLRGKPAFDRILRGISQLGEHGIPFSIISVVGTLGITMPEELLEFLTSLGGHSVGFNIEEIEGGNTTGSHPPSFRPWNSGAAPSHGSASILAPQRSGRSNGSPSTSS
jgi:sulfatase maturation enzyme AslB (radical SAM superfamily)